MKQFCKCFIILVLTINWLCPGQDNPYQVLYNHDTTNTLTCVTNPWNLARNLENFPTLIELTVDEAADAGADAIMFSSSMGWQPWWPSSFYPNHYDWYLDKCSELGLTPRITIIDNYVIGGGDVMDVFLQRCRLNGVGAFVSFRLNDVHHSNDLVCKFYYDHPQYKNGTTTSAHQKGHNWSYQEARDYKLGIIQEICQNYDLDGIELDFLRFPAYFPESNPPSVETRKQIISDFVGSVRNLMDTYMPATRQRYLCVRIPDNIADFTNSAIGIDVEAMAAAGVDMINLSHYYWTSQQGDIAQIRSLVPGVKLYNEYTHQAEKNYARRTSRHHFYTAAHTAYERGIDGISLFNFQYYREHGEIPGPFNEPPFDVIELFHSPARLAKQDQCYFYAGAMIRNAYQDQYVGSFTVGQEKNFTLQMAPTQAHLASVGPAILRFQVDPYLPADTWQVKFNGQILSSSTQTQEPYDNEFVSGIGSPEEYRAFEVPKNIILNGLNTVAIKLLSSTSSKNINWLEVSLSMPQEGQTALWPYPENGKLNVDTAKGFSWVPAQNSSLYILYLDENYNKVDTATFTSDIQYQGFPTNNYFTFDFVFDFAFEENKRYYWRVDCFDGTNLIKGPIWHFDTGSVAVLDDYDLNDDGKIDFLDYSILAGSYGLQEAQVGYRPDCDFDSSGLIDLYDVMTFFNVTFK